MKKLVLLIMIGAFLAAGGTALAWNDAEHVIQAPNSEGDLMFFPVGVALDGWDTKITVTNTSSNRSAVAKVIVRSAGFSKELLDFLIYLSPTDVWTGTLKHGTAGPVMYSDDDSCLSGPGVWANVVPMNQPLVDVCANDTNEIVYVTVIEAWSSNNAEGDPFPLCDLYDPPVPKDCIYDAYHDHFGATNDSPYNILTGHYELSVLGAFTIGDRAEVMRDYDNRIKMLATAVQEIGTGADNNLCEIEAALSKNHLAMPYYNDATKLALHWVTFVTKLTQVEDCLCDFNKGPFTGWGYWDGEDYICKDVVFSPLYFDLRENSPGCEETVFSPYEPPPDRVFPYEVNFLFTVPTFISANYEEGWVEYNFSHSTTCDPKGSAAHEIRYNGAPAIASAWLLNDNGLCLIPSAHVDGRVEYDHGSGFMDLIYYQYVNDDNGEYLVAP